MRKMVPVSESYFIYPSWNAGSERRSRSRILSVCFKQTHVKQYSCACMPVCLQWNHVLKRIQLHYIYNYVVATSYQLPACLLAVVHFSFLCVLILFYSVELCWSSLLVPPPHTIPAVASWESYSGPIQVLVLPCLSHCSRKFEVLQIQTPSLAVMNPSLYLGSCPISSEWMDNWSLTRSKVH